MQSKMLVGVLARLCSHLREMTGLTIRATVSQTGLRDKPPRLSHVGQALDLLPGFSRPAPLDARLRNPTRVSVAV